MRLLERMKPVSIEEAWSVLRRHGFNQQFEGNWVLAGPEGPGPGRTSRDGLFSTDAARM